MISALKGRVFVVASVCALITLIHCINVFMDNSLSQYGIIPRNSASLPYIFTSPFIHLDVFHLTNNLIGLLIFSSLCLVKSIRFFLWSSAFIIAVGGGLVWLFGRSASHIGASGWIFGLWGLCIALAWFDRKFLNIVIAIFVIIFYGGMRMGIFPAEQWISFEGHLFGVLAGVLCAYISTLLSTEKEQHDVKEVAT
jgi:membrane associated rhomboid family serine protease